jgi:hypothetical protein
VKKTSLFFLLFLFWGILPRHAAAAAPGGAPANLSWANEVYEIFSDSPPTAAGAAKIADDTVKQTLADEIGMKLRALDAQGLLPFKLRTESAGYETTAAREQVMGLIALIADESVSARSYTIGGQDYTKEFVFCGLDLMICSASKTDGSVRILYTVPLRGYGIARAEGRSVGIEARRAEFVRVAKTLLQDLSFAQKKGRVFTVDELDLRSLGESYQVKDILLSAKAAELFGGAGGKIKELLAGVFTSAYQKTTGRTVFPPALGGNWKKDAATGLWSTEVAGGMGRRKLTMPEAENPITLEVSGIAWKDISRSENTALVNMVYRAWMKKSPVETGEKAELDKHILHNYARFNMDEARDDIFMELLTTLATDLGSQKSSGQGKRKG